MKREIYINALMLIALFLAGIAVNQMIKISDITEKIQINLATFSQKVLDHERRIQTLENDR